MDPNAVWRLILEALRTLQSNPADEEVRIDAVFTLESLAQWLDGGGYPPTIEDVMDPNATWRLLCETLREIAEHPNDRELRVIAASLLQALAEWMRRGGFPPTV